MTVLTVFASTADGYIDSDATGNTYSWARDATAGTRTVDTAGTSLTIGQDYNGFNDYHVYQAFLSFDTSALGSSATISAVALNLYAGGTFPGASFTSDVYSYDWTPGGLTSADWQTSWGTLLASNASWASGYNSFTENGSNFQSTVNKTGTTPITVVSHNDVANSAPSGTETITVNSADSTGTANDPKLVITYTAPTTTNKNLAGTLTSAGTLVTNFIHKLLASGSLTSAGTVMVTAVKSLYTSGTLAPSGVMSKTITKRIAGAFGSLGSVFVEAVTNRVVIPTFVSGANGSSSVSPPTGTSTVDGMVGTSTVSGIDGTTGVG